MPRADHRWEHGSFFDARAVPAGEPAAVLTSAQLFGSGRAAIRAVLRAGRERGWRRLHVPSYYCHDVTRYLRADVDVELYDAGPTSAPSQLRLGPDEVALVVEYFGARSAVEVSGGAVVLDRTHDPLADWAYPRAPDVVVASLRKTLPLPDGGAAWSADPGLVPAPPPRASLEATSARAWSAMGAKWRYLTGGDDAKDAYLAQHRQAEDALAREDVAAASRCTRRLLATLPAHAMRLQRHRNVAAFRDAFTAAAGVRVHDAPAFVVLRAPDPHARDLLREELRRRDIYAAVTWPLDDVDAAEAEDRFSRTMLVLHADHRYTEEDLRRVAHEVEAASVSVVGARRAR